LKNIDDRHCLGNVQRPLKSIGAGFKGMLGVVLPVFCGTFVCFTRSRGVFIGPEDTRQLHRCAPESRADRVAHRHHPSTKY
jgi:hypothetical protein